MTLEYTNPVWDGYLADPFVLKWNKKYYAYGTSLKEEPDGSIFPVLHSRDLVHWHKLGGALPPLHEPGTSAPAMWAPEVAEHNGKFYMYYSAASGSGDETHRLRVAVAEHPAGPFEDSGLFLVQDENFTIDASPFCDPKDGKWYLFFAKDFFDERIGTGIAMVPLGEDMISVSGPAQTVVRASADWQIYERNRSIYGKKWSAWHTVEGPSVVFHEGKYYCLYSGGSWQTENYGVSYAVSDNVLGPYEDEWSKEGPAVLKGIPDKVLGPGHNSVVVGPDEETLFMVYHAWDSGFKARRMCIDPLLWTPDGPRCLGPSWTPQVWTPQKAAQMLEPTTTG